MTERARERERGLPSFARDGESEKERTRVQRENEREHERENKRENKREHEKARRRKQND